MDDLPERVKVLEIKVNGNGSPGLMQRMARAEQELDTQYDMMMLYDKNTMTYVTGDALRTIVREEIKAADKGFLKHSGPILTGLAALLLALGQIL